MNEKTINFYETNYDLVGQWFVSPEDKIVLGDNTNKICRFCSRKPPEVSFQKVAHAIPEALGNKSIASHYECDECNELFGQGIENDLGNWTKPNRTFARIRGKNGVPTIKKIGPTSGWRIEYKNQSGMHIKAYEDDPIFEVNEAEKTATFSVIRDAYTPVGVLKAFMKIGLSLMPENEVDNFQPLIKWIIEKDHSKSYVENVPVIHTFVPGPMKSDFIAASIIRRKPTTLDLPYLFLVIGFGNDIYQLWLPSSVHDMGNGQTIKIPPFNPFSGVSSEYGPSVTKLISLSSSIVVKNEIQKIRMGFDHLEKN